MKSFVLISRVRPPKLEDGSSSVGNCPGDVANGSRRFCPTLLVSLRNHTHTCTHARMHTRTHARTHIHVCFQCLRLATSSSFSPRNPVGLIFKILFDVDKSGHIGVKVFARVPYLSRRNDEYSFSLKYREHVFCKRVRPMRFFIL